MEYASRGVANAGLTTGIIGTALGGLNALGALGAAVGVPAAAQASAQCSENTAVNRYELNQLQTIANKDMEIAYWRGQDETNRKISDTYAKLESRINDVSAEVRANKNEQNAVNMQQAVYNGVNTATVGCIQEQVNQLLAMTKRVVPNSSVCPGWGDVTVKVVNEGTTTT